MRAGSSATQAWGDARRARRRRRLLVTLAAGVLAAAAVALLRDRHPAEGAVAAAVTFSALLAGWSGPDPDRWLRGARGEEGTANLLAGLPARRYLVLHDLRVPGSRANIDHVVVCRSGVWVIDSKTSRAPVSVGWRGVRMGSRWLDVEAVRWEAEVVADCAGLAGRGVRPVVAVHAASDTLPFRGAVVKGVRVLPAPGLARHIGRRWRRRRLSKHEVMEVAGRIGTTMGRQGPGAGTRSG